MNGQQYGVWYYDPVYAANFLGETEPDLCLPKPQANTASASDTAAVASHRTQNLVHVVTGRILFVTLEAISRSQRLPIEISLVGEESFSVLMSSLGRPIFKEREMLGILLRLNAHGYSNPTQMVFSDSYPPGALNVDTASISMSAWTNEYAVQVSSLLSLRCVALIFACPHAGTIEPSIGLAGMLGTSLERECHRFTGAYKQFLFQKRPPPRFCKIRMSRRETVTAQLTQIDKMGIAIAVADVHVTLDAADAVTGSMEA